MATGCGSLQRCLTLRSSRRSTAFRRCPRLSSNVRRTGGRSGARGQPLRDRNKRNNPGDIVIGRNNRRDFLVALGGVLALPRSAVAQQAERIYRLGWLSTATLRTELYGIAFVQRLRELGFAEGRNLVIEFRTAQGRAERLSEFAAELARQNCDVLLAPGGEAALAALKRASQDTPIVMVANDYDPVATGHVASLARPGGRITGVSQLQSELPAKRLELLKELLPSANRIAVFSDINTAGQLTAVQAGAKRLGVELQVIEFKRAPYELRKRFRRSSAGQGGGAAGARFGLLCTCAPADCGAGAEASPALDVRQLLVGGGWRAAFLRAELLGPLPPSGGTGEHDPERR